MPTVGMFGELIGGVQAEELARLEASTGVRYTEQEIADRVTRMSKIRCGT
jgi:hypothetical protein